MKNIKRLPIYVFLGLSLAACSESDDLEKTAAGTESPKTTQINDSKMVSNNSADKGLECAKKSTAMLSTTYIGLVTIDGTLYTGIRADNTAVMGDQVQKVGSTLSLDDGESAQVYSWNDSVVISLPKTTETAMPPAEHEFNLEMAKRIYGDCKSWTVDADLLQRPKSL